MIQFLAAVSCLAVAAVSVYLLCRHLSCARLPALFGAAAWTFSEALLTPGAAARPLAQAGSSVLVPFVLAGAFTRERRRWGFLALALVCVLLRWRLPAGAAGGCGVLEALVVAVLAGLGAQRLWDGEGAAAFVSGATAAVIASMARPGAGTATLLIEALPAAAALALVALTSREARARAGLVALVALFAVQRALEIGVGAAAGRRAAVATVAKAMSPRP